MEARRLAKNRRMKSPGSMQSSAPAGGRKNYVLEFRLGMGSAASDAYGGLPCLRVCSDREGARAQGALGKKRAQPGAFLCRDRIDRALRGGAAWSRSDRMGLSLHPAGPVSDVSSSILYSLSAITSYGHSNIFLEERWRLLGAIEAMNGLILFGLTTAFLFAAIEEVRPVDGIKSSPYPGDVTSHTLRFLPFAREGEASSWWVGSSTSVPGWPFLQSCFEQKG